MSSNVLYGIQLHPCGQICYFSAGSWPDLNVGAKVVVRIDRGEALGQVVKLMTTKSDGDKNIPQLSNDNSAQESNFVDSNAMASTGNEESLENESALDSPGANAYVESSNGLLEQATEANTLHNNFSDAPANISPDSSPSPSTPKEKETIFAGEVYQWDNWEEENGLDEYHADDDSEPSLCLDPYADDIPSILRPATELDINLAKNNAEAGLAARLFCANRARQHKLDMKMVMADYLLDGSKIIFYFTAPNRIDFRELVKDLVKEFRTRIELRQIGVRHETQMIGATGNCGMVCCCRRYMRKFAPVTIKMAKEQNLFLNPTKISGTCGRLLCCLAFEQEGYEEFHSLCPKMGKKYNTNRGSVKVLRSSIFRNSLTLLPEEGDEYEVHLDEWQEMEATRQGNNQPPAHNPNNQDTNRDKLERPERGRRPGRQERAGQAEQPANPEHATNAGNANDIDSASKLYNQNNENIIGKAEEPNGPNFSDRPNRPNRPDGPYNPDRPDRPDRSDRPAKEDRPYREDRENRAARPNRPDNPDRPGNTERPGNTDRQGRPDRAPRQDKPARQDGQDKTDRPGRYDRPARTFRHGTNGEAEKFDRNKQFADKGSRNPGRDSKVNNLSEPEPTKLGDANKAEAHPNSRVESSLENAFTQKPEAPEQKERTERNDNSAFKNNQANIKEPANSTQKTGLSRFLATTAVDDEDE